MKKYILYAIAVILMLASVFTFTFAPVIAEDTELPTKLFEMLSVVAVFGSLVTFMAARGDGEEQ